MDRYAHVIQYVLSAPLAIQTEMAAMIQMILVMRRNGHRFSAEEIQARIGAGPSARQTASSANIAVIPVIGCIMHRMELMSDISSSGTSPDMLARAFRSALADPNVSAIVLDIDSPGGTVFGLMELGDEIRAARGKKPVVAVANGIAASAAYWIGSQAEEFVVTPSGQVGSIGVVSMHENLSKMLENEGIEVTLIHSSKYKVEGNPFGPLTAEAHEAIKADVDAYDGLFVRAVAKGRGVSVEKVRSEFGMGRMIMANDAAARGMVDGVETFDQVIARLMKPKRAALTGAAAASNGHEPIADDIHVHTSTALVDVIENESTPTRSADYYRSRVAIAQRKGAEHGVPA